ncbi:TPM domain-containing protein [Corynebacterium diphtheriae]|nr:TPM domain-containing protein [Corynebacterium diphtheriae]
MRESSDQITPEAGWAAFDASVVDARSALELAHAHADQDPLETWSTLTAADSALDIQLAYARDAAADHERRSMVFQQQLSSAQSSVQTTADFISTRGRVIKSAARTRLAEAEKLLAHAHNAASSDVVRATDFAREADRTARSALSLAKRDYRDYQQRQSSNRGGGMGGIITGMVLNEILSNNHRGGFGGGFGGGGGGGFRGGSF